MKSNAARPLGGASPHFVKCRYHLLGGLTEDARYLGAAGWADALGKTSSIGLFDVTGELPLCLALNAVRLAGVTLSHWDLRLIAEPLGGRPGGVPHHIPSGFPHDRAIAD